MRGQVLAVTAREYVEAARALGAPGWCIACRHVLPDAVAPIVVQASLSVAFAILAEASLSCLGLGIQPPAASRGSMIDAGRSSVSTSWATRCATLSIRGFARETAPAIRRARE